ncbi:MAG TPA: hypothetical protein VF747_04795 [Blastocatellia bacterium]|jgi:Spy/CpxP family protein refolding chaperone
MKKLSIVPYLVAIAIILTSATDGALAQGRANSARLAAGAQGIVRASLLNPQFGRRKNRLPGDQRNMNRTPLGNPQSDRPQSLNQARKQELRRRLMQAIGLTPEQHQRMQEIRRGHEDEAIAAGRRLRQARQALDRAIMSEPYNDASVRQATEELAAAQADKIRLESRIRAQVRGVLTSEQVLRFHQLERQVKREMREQERQNRERPPQGVNAPEQRVPLAPGDVDLVGLLSLAP